MFAQSGQATKDLTTHEAARFALVGSFVAVHGIAVVVLFATDVA